MKRLDHAPAVIETRGADDDFTSTLRVFARIPDHHHDVLPFRGQVIVFETDTLGREGIQEGALYVVENQHAPSRMAFDMWLRLELDDRSCRAQPRSRLTVSRYVVRMVRHEKYPDMWLRRLESGFIDGPFEEWNAPLDLIGKVAGIYRPQ